MKTSQKIWDFPTRAFHWLLVLMVGGGALTGFLAPDSWLDIHVWFGTAFLALISFRLIWGFLGSYHSRFSSFTFSIAQTRDHVLGLLKGNPSHHAGHNPLGALMIFVLIGTLLILTLSGFVVLGGEEKQGPLGGIVPYFIGEAFEEVHEALAAFLLFLIGGHLLGVLAESLLSKQNLARSMITGRKVIDETDHAKDKPVVHKGRIFCWPCRTRPYSCVIFDWPSNDLRSRIGGCNSDGCIQYAIQYRVRGLSPRLSPKPVATKKLDQNDGRTGVSLWRGCIPRWQGRQIP